MSSVFRHYFQFVHIYDLHLKQNYLKSEIIDKNINPDKFMNYCLTIKENGDDINSWNFEELKECVANFNELLQKESQEEKEKENMSSQNAYLSNTNQEQSPIPILLK